MKIGFSRASIGFFSILFTCFQQQSLQAQSLVDFSLDQAMDGVNQIVINNLVAPKDLAALKVSDLLLTKENCFYQLQLDTSFSQSVSNLPVASPSSYPSTTPSAYPSLAPIQNNIKAFLNVTDQYLESTRYPAGFLHQDPRLPVQYPSIVRKKSIEIPISFARATQLQQAGAFAFHQAITSDATVVLQAALKSYMVDGKEKALVEDLDKGVEKYMRIGHSLYPLRLTDAIKGKFLLMGCSSTK